MTAVLLDLQWRYAFVNGSRVAHLVPPEPGPLSRTACHRIPLAGAHLEEQLGALYEEPKRCRSCAKAGRS